MLIGPQRGDGFEARIERFIDKAPRGDAFCPYFETCGGCSVQHLNAETYADWKRGILLQALARRGVDAEVLSLAAVPRDARRRVTFQAEKQGKAVRVGFNERRANRITVIEACPLLRPELNDVLPALKDLAEKILDDRQRARFAVAVIDGPEHPALDIVIENDREPDLAVREALAEFSRTVSAARVSWRDDEGLVEPVASIAPVVADFGRASVEIPPGGFMQPTREGEGILRDAVIAGCSGASAIVELFAGAGTFTMALAGICQVRAVDGDEALSRALSTAAGRSALGGRISVETRDLAQRPLLPDEMTGVDTAVLDPPRAGALRQVEQVVLTPGIRRVVMVSCNPQTFARDLRVLMDGGFSCGPVLPVDQFPFSHHLECVAALDRTG